MYYTSGYKYKILVTLNGVAVKGKKVIIKFNKKTYLVITDKNGYAILKLDAKPGKYTITATYDNVKLNKNITVKSIVSAKNLKVKKSAKKGTAPSKTSASAWTRSPRPDSAGSGQTRSPRKAAQRKRPGSLPTNPKIQYLFLFV